MIELRPVRDLPEVTPGDDLAALITAAHADLRDGDVLVIAHKVVSKAEGALVSPEPGEGREAARRRLAREHARRIVADSPWVVVTETAHGFVCANGGIDASNAPDGLLVLLPSDPDASAARLRSELASRAGVDVAVVVTDTFGRPWRYGQTDVAIGVAGIAPLRDERGGVDRHGMRLTVTEAAVADELAAAADLTRTKADGTPVVIVRGLAWTADDTASARALQRPAAEDLFRTGRGGLASALAVPDPQPVALPAERDALAHAWAAADAQAGADVTLVDLGPDGAAGAGPSRLGITGSPPACWLAAGVLLACLVEQGHTAALVEPRPDEPEVVLVAGRADQSEPRT